MTEHGLGRDVTFSHEQDVTADDLNELVRRLWVLESLVQPARVIDSEHAQTLAVDRAAEVVYLTVRVAPLVASGVAGLLVVAAFLFPRLGSPLWADWCRCMCFAAVAVPFFLTAWVLYRARQCPSRWTVVEHPNGKRAAEFRRLFGPAWPNGPEAVIGLTSSWLSSQLGLVWAVRAGWPPVLIPGASRSEFFAAFPTIVRDKSKSARETFTIAAGLWVIGVALAYWLLPQFWAFAGDSGVLLLVAVIPVFMLVYCELWLAAFGYVTNDDDNSPFLNPKK